MLFGKIEDMLGRVAASMEKAQECLFSRQQPLLRQHHDAVQRGPDLQGVLLA